MFRRLRRRIRYKILRAIVSTRRNSKKILAPQEGLDDTQKLTILIIKKLVSISETEIMLLPVGSIDNATKYCYIEYRDVIAKILPSNKVQLINGKYFYDVYLPNQHYDDIRFHVYQRMVKKRNTLERKITDKTERSLKNILFELENRDI
jgi:hypothetical protein